MNGNALATIVIAAITFGLVPTFVLAPAPCRAAPPAEVIDGIVASINGTPLTLQDLGKRLTPPRQLTFKEAAENAEAREALEVLIIERLLEEEATAHRINVTDSQVEEYVEQVAKRNNLSRPAFEQALRSEGKDIANYKHQVRFEILQSRLASTVLQDGVAVSDKEVDEYLEQTGALSQKGSKIKLRQILLAFEHYGEEKAKELGDSLKKRIESGEDFSKLAREFSDAPDAADGGSLGVIAEEELNSMIFDAVLALKEGETSAPTASPQGIHLFRVDQRFSEEGQDTGALREEVRATLKRQKLNAKMQTYFSDELYKRYAVDKKI